MVRTQGFTLTLALTLPQDCPSDCLPNQGCAGSLFPGEISIRLSEIRASGWILEVGSLLVRGQQGVHYGSIWVITLISRSITVTRLSGRGQRPKEQMGEGEALSYAVTVNLNKTGAVMTVRNTASVGFH